MSPAGDNEEFAIGADDRTGSPVTRTVRDMSAEEVVAAVNLHVAAANRGDDAARQRLRRLLELVARRRSVTGDNRPKP
jgi:hypothetical protein